MTETPTTRLRYFCCPPGGWEVIAAVTRDLRLLVNPKHAQCPECGRPGRCHDNPFTTPRQTATEVTEQWGFLQDRFGREEGRA